MLDEHTEDSQSMLEKTHRQVHEVSLKELL